MSSFFKQPEGTINPGQAGSLLRILDSVIVAGRTILNRRGRQPTAPHHPPHSIAELCTELVKHRGEASGLALAREILDRYAMLKESDKLLFFEILLRNFPIDAERVIAAAERYRNNPNFDRLGELAKAMASPRQKLFRRLNMVPGGTGALVEMRGDLLNFLPQKPTLSALEAELKLLLIEWFNRGFLQLQQINWDSSARVLEKIIEHEAVHEINGWSDLRSRLKEDRRLFAFFHPAMPDDPVIFVEIALGRNSATAIAPLIDIKRQVLELTDVDTATFYSISNCHSGLQGISFGNFLIKQVTEHLRAEIPSIKRFETLSPVPGFRDWLQHLLHKKPLPPDLKLLRNLNKPGYDWSGCSASVRSMCLRLCADYLIKAKRGELPVDPVARFHLSNGAYLDNIHWAADLSANGLRRSYGLMVNYVYKPEDIEKNHEAYFEECKVAVSGNLRKLMRGKNNHR